MSERLKINLCGVEFNNPVIAASGTFGYGLEFSRFTDLNRIGGISVKGISLKETYGNKMPRIAETASGMLNAIGLQNIGVERFISEKLPLLKKYDTKIIANFWGKNIEEYAETAAILDRADVDMLEMNISCPNIKEGGLAFSSSPMATEEIVKVIRKVITHKPLIVKLSPNVADIKPFAAVCEKCGVDAISLINTLLGMAIDVETMKPKLANITGGLSGPAIKPVAVRMVYEAKKTVHIPIIGMGGIAFWEDAAEFFLAGASAVQVGTANFRDPDSCIKISEGLNSFLEKKNIANISELTGRAVLQ